MESAGILCDRVQFPAQGAETATVNAVAVRRGNDVWTSLMDGRMYHKSRCVEESDFSPINDFALFVDQDKIGGFNQGKSNAEWVNPKGVWINWVLKSHIIRQQFVLWH